MNPPELKPWARSALWIGCGGFVGIALGALIVNPGRAVSFAFLWLLLLVAFVGGVAWYGRVPPQDPNAQYAFNPGPAQGTRPIPQPTATGPLQMRFTLLDVPGGFPPVLGEGEVVKTRVRAMSRDQPAAGAAVRLTGALRDGPRFLAGEGVTGSDGTVEFTVRPHGRGELLLEAEARLEGLTGTATTSLGVVSYEEEIERLFSEFRGYALAVRGADAHADTARELAERLRVGTTPETARALLELARIYELVAYGERAADRRLYLALMNELLVLEHADLPEPPAPAATPAGG